jgi:hypothetical protein
VNGGQQLLARSPMAQSMAIRRDRQGATSSARRLRR